MSGTLHPAVHGIAEAAEYAQQSILGVEPAPAPPTVRQVLEQRTRYLVEQVDTMRVFLLKTPAAVLDMPAGDFDQLHAHVMRY